MEILKMKMHMFLVPFFPRASFQGAERRICRFRRLLTAACRMGVAILLDARTIFEGHKGWAFSGAVSDTESEGSLHDLPNSLVVGSAANALGDVVIAGACREHNFDDHVVEFGNLQLAASAESGYVLHRLNSRNSLICHPCMCLLLHVLLMEVWWG